MVALWVVVGLVVSAVCVSVLGAAFSVVGIAALFSGAALSVCLMAGSLELAKFVLAAYLHQRWTHVNLLIRTYLLAAIVVLSGITSMGIFGFLSDAYQSASSVFEAENLKLDALKVKKSHSLAEIDRLTKSIDEIPANRVTRRIQARKEMEPVIAEMTKNIAEIDQKIGDANLVILEVKKKVGPLIYISKMFDIEIDSVVKYLILVFVLVFDPLAICLVIATSESLETRRRHQEALARNPSLAAGSPPESEPVFKASAPAEEEVIKMRFAEEDAEQDQEVG